MRTWKKDKTKQGIEPQTHKMKLYLVFVHHQCEDRFYGYYEQIESIYTTQEEAQSRINHLLRKGTYLSRAGSQAFVT